MTIDAGHWHTQTVEDENDLQAIVQVLQRDRRRLAGRRRSARPARGVGIHLSERPDPR